MGVINEGKRLWLWIAAGATLLIISSAVTFLVVSKTTAESNAKKSTEEVIAYLDRILVAAQSTTDVTAATKAVRSIEPPVFEEVPYGDANEAYRTAKKVHEDAVRRADDFMKTLDGYANILAFYPRYTSWTEAFQALRPADVPVGQRTRDLAYLNAAYDSLKEVNKTIATTTVASDYSNEFIELGRVYDSMATTIEGVARAVELNASDAYESLYRQYENASMQVTRVEGGLGIYATSIPDRITSEVTKLREYRDELSK